MKKYRIQIIVGAVIFAVLAAAFWWGGSAPGPQGQGQTVTAGGTVSPSPSAMPAEAAVSPTPAGAGEDSTAPTDAPPATPTAAPAASKAPVVPEVREKDEPATVENKPVKENNQPMTAEEKVELAAQMAGEAPAEPENGEGTALQQMQLNGEAAPAGMPAPIDPQDAEISDKKLTCTLSVQCDTILANMAWLDPEKVELVPGDGVILAEQTVTFYEGESVFNLLLREMKRNKIHFEYQNTPIYKSAYIEGIGNLYEMDCGELSGWLYKVNGWFPSYGCSRYQLREGDRVEWVYTCDLGTDVGRDVSALGGS